MNMNLKNSIVSIVTFFLGILLIPCFIMISDMAIGDRFIHSFYGELQAMYQKLEKAEGKKIVIIGNSNIAFGVDSALIQEELKADFCEYTVCNFGLYGAIGTKVMLELALSEIEKDDIVIFAPELSRQALSMYFSAAEAWRAIESNREMALCLSEEEITSLVANYASFVAEKYSYEEVIVMDGIYAASSFDDNCDLKNYSREENIMFDGYDSNNLISLDFAQFDTDFIEYLNAYNEEITARGATMYYSFCPMNKKALAEDYEIQLEELYEQIDKAINFEIIGNPYDYVMDCEWFYDSNVHLNSAGMTLRSIILTEEIKNVLGLTAPVRAQIPTMPELPERNENTGKGDNTFAEYFEYEEVSGGYAIVGLKAEGYSLSEIVIPYSYNDQQVLYFKSNVFAENTTIKAITIQENVIKLEDGSFEGCTKLKKLILEQEDPKAINVGYGLLNGIEGLSIYVPGKSYASYNNDYFWGYYAGYFEKN